MKRQFTMQDLAKTPAGRRQDNAPLFQPLEKTEQLKPASKEKAFIEQAFQKFCRQLGCDMKTEYRFHGVRRWRFDYAAPDVMVAVEYEGIMSGKSRHTTFTGYSGDSEKYNAAAGLGWKVYRYTALTYENIIDDLNKNHEKDF